MQKIDQDKIVILDFGSQYTQLIARRIREIGVLSEIVSCEISPKELLKLNPRGIIFSGGPESVNSKFKPTFNSKILEIGKDLIINKSKKYYEFIGLFKASEKAAVAMKNTFLMIDNKINSKDKFERSSSWSNAYLTDFFQFIINNNILDINVNIVSKGWAEFDTIEDYNRLNNIIKSQKLISIK